MKIYANNYYICTKQLGFINKEDLESVIHTKTVFASVLGDLVKIPERGIFLCVKIPEKEIFCLVILNLAP